MVKIYKNATFSVASILGAWGCGVFGNKSEDIANDFKLILSEEKYKNAFEVVEFSVLCGRRSKEIAPFEEIFIN